MTTGNRLLPNACPTVPTTERGTAGQTPTMRDSTRDRTGTESLQTLARRVLARLGERDKDGTAPAISVPTPLMPVGQDRHSPSSAASENIDFPMDAALDRWAQFEERAAICEHDGKLTRKAAEELARAELEGWVSGVD